MKQLLDHLEPMQRDTKEVARECLYHHTKAMISNLHKVQDYMRTVEFYNLQDDEKSLLYDEQRARLDLVQVLGKRCKLHGINLLHDYEGKK